MSSRSIHSMIDSRSSSTERSMPLRADSAWRRKLRTETPAISCGYWKARNMPALPRTSVGPVGDVVALEADAAAGDLVLGAAEQGAGEGGLARAVGPHEGVDLARLGR